MTLAPKGQDKKERLADTETKREKTIAFFDIVFVILGVIAIVVLICALVVAQTMDESGKPLLNVLFFISFGSAIVFCVGVWLLPPRDNENT